MQIICPACRVPPVAWEVNADTLTCANSDCARVFERLGGVPALLATGIDEVRMLDVLGDLGDGLVERVQSLAPGSAEAEHALRTAMYVRSHYLDRPNFIDALGEQLLSRIETRVATAVDLGCGVGGMSLEVAHRFGADVVGIDSNPLALRWAQRAASAAFQAPVRCTARHIEMMAVDPPGPPPRGSLSWLCANVSDPPLAAESCDLVMLVNVLDSVSNPSAVLAQAAALVAPGGHLLVAQPDAWSASNAPPEHWLAEDEAGWDEVIEQVGLRTLHRVDDIAWTLRRTDRCSFDYRLHARLAVRSS